MRFSFFSCLLVSSLALAGCSTITNGGTQNVDVVVKGSPAAFCVFTNGTATNSGTFPNKMVVERSHQPLKAECYGEQNLYKKFEVAAVMSKNATLGNATTGVGPGLGYDLVSGGAWYYPSPIIVDFRVIETAPKDIWPDNKVDAAGVGTAKIVKPQPAHMSPVLDEALDPSQGGAPVVKRPAPVSSSGSAAPLPLVGGQTGAMMKPVASPQDDPNYWRARAAARKKAAAEAARVKAAAAKAKADAEAKAKAEAEAAAAAAKAQEEAEAAKATAVEDTAPAPATLESPDVAPAPEQPGGDSAGDSSGTDEDADRYLKAQ